MKPLHKYKDNDPKDYGLASLVLEKGIYCIMVLIFLAVFSSQIFAQELTSLAYSQGQLKKNEAHSQALAKKVKQALAKNMALAHTSTKITRDQMLAEEKNQRANSNKTNNRQSRNGFHEFSIYSASSKLFEDDDGDGYFNTFGVLFDADVINTHLEEPANVYAEIYLSQDNGPWFHLYTTEIFTIFGDSSADEYEVITHLTENYSPDHYHVLIDLYEAGLDGIVASYSADDTSLLYALPLESQDYEYYDEHHGGHHDGGSGSFLSILFLTIFMLVRSVARQSSYLRKAS